MPLGNKVCMAFQLKGVWVECLLGLGLVSYGFGFSLVFCWSGFSSLGVWV